MKRIAALFAFALSFAVLAGCNTVHGLGQDIEKAGAAISGAAK